MNIRVDAYEIEVRPDTESGGFVAEVPALPGCITEGETVEETLENARDAIKSYLEAVKDLEARGVKLPLPKPRRPRTAGSEEGGLLVE